LYWPGRKHLLRNLYFVFMPRSSGVLFVEVLMGDVMTSISKVMADMGVTTCIFLKYFLDEDMSAMGTDSHSHISSKSEFLKAVGSNEAVADAIMANFHDCTSSWARPMLISLPFLLRFRQCWVHYKATKDTNNLLNCLKYFSSLPVIWISAVSQHYPDAASDHMHTAWIIAVTINSFYSFMWDITMDWGLCMDNSNHVLLRHHLVYSLESNGQRKVDSSCKQVVNPISYYVAIVLDLLLRILWSFNLSAHFQLTREGLTFFLEVCEVFRRFLWLFLRVEWQYVKSVADVSVAVHVDEDVEDKLVHSVEMANISEIAENPAEVSSSKGTIRSRSVDVKR